MGAVAVLIQGIEIRLGSRDGAAAARIVVGAGEVVSTDDLSGGEGAGFDFIRVVGGVVGRGATAAESRVGVVDPGVDDGDGDAIPGVAGIAPHVIGADEVDAGAQGGLVFRGAVDTLDVLHRLNLVEFTERDLGHQTVVGRSVL